ncbi:hypothetical protein DPEC_G00007940 [Dallia pectoralis]|uniref:Uncharacterized protein n=1 Tax=Dallia pectoralis TaxID=75939 RepID=A0ACC2HLD8_DALPE|nr:hypothetical protein DPEC_G00007940 [Dallia pectoralis]
MKSLGMQRGEEGHGRCCLALSEWEEEDRRRKKCPKRKRAAPQCPRIQRSSQCRPVPTSRVHRKKNGRSHHRETTEESAKKTKEGAKIYTRKKTLSPGDALDESTRVFLAAPNKEACGLRHPVPDPVAQGALQIGRPGPSVRRSAHACFSAPVWVDVSLAKQRPKTMEWRAERIIRWCCETGSPGTTSDYSSGVEHYRQGTRTQAATGCS